jgi:uncharacterized OB-fold protein
VTVPEATDQLRPVAEGLFTVEPPQLTGGRCSSCQAVMFPRRQFCPECQRDAVEGVGLSTSGTVYTFTIVRMVPPGYRGEAPYAYGVVELPEGLRLTSTLVADDLEAIDIGDRCEFILLELGAGEDRVVSFAYRVGGAG